MSWHDFAPAKVISERAGVTAWYFGGAVGWGWVATVASGSVWWMVVLAVTNLFAGCIWVSLTVRALLETGPTEPRPS